MSKNTAVEFYPTSKKSWREWLEVNHLKEDAVWVIFYKQKINKPTMTWSESVDEALCFGWIDSTKRSLDSERFIQYFSKRKPKSTWSKVNKDKVKVLIATGQMKPKGLLAIETAKNNGSWELLDSVDNLIVPDDFQEILNSDVILERSYSELSPSRKKSILHRLLMAKRPETRVKRISEIIDELQLQKNLFD